MARVLIADDDPLVLETVVQMIESAGHTTSTAVNGKDAIHQCHLTPPDLVIMDMIMPEMEGLETIKQIRQHFPHMKIVAVSGGGSLRPKDYLDVARKLGADIALTKPFDRDELVGAVDTLLNR